MNVGVAVTPATYNMTTELVHLPLGFPQERAPRTSGIHVSNIIRSIAYEQGILKPEWVEDLSLVDCTVDGWWESLTSDSKIRLGLGMAWEEWYLPTVPGVVFHPGEMCVDGIYMTHDGESLDTLRTGHSNKYGLILHEVKTTYKSTKTVANLETQWLWLAQSKAYCKGLNILTAFLHVLFLCGDYKYPIKPQLKVWKVDYTQAEIDDNWDVLTSYVRHRQVMEREETGLEGGV